MSTDRRQRLLENVPPKSVILLSNTADIRYFFGPIDFLTPGEREALALISQKQSCLFTLPLSNPVKIEQCTVVQRVDIGSVFSFVTEWFDQKVASKLLIDERSLFADEYRFLSDRLKEAIAPLNRQEVWKLRMRKDDLELAAIKQASEISVKSLEQLRSEIAVGQTELEVADRLEALMRQNGSRKLAFPTIVAFGDHAALPHHQPSERKLTKETPILIDFGASVDGYCSDMTRTFWFGSKPTTDFQRIERAVLDAYQATVDVLSRRGGGVTAAQLDRAARDVIEQAGYGKRFIHTTGHGLGLDIHEPPSLNSQNSTLIQPGMVITIEPGIYLPGKFGYRHENTYLTAQEKSHSLTD